MASVPYPDKRRGVWRMKYRPDPTGPWVSITLGKDPRLLSANPPKRPPADIAAMANELAEREYRARNALDPLPSRPRPLVEYVDEYLERYRESRESGSAKNLERAAGIFTAWCQERGIATVQGLSKVHCRDYLDMRLKSISAATLKTERGYLAAIWARAVFEEIIPYSPWPHAKIKAPTKTAKVPRFWTAEEVRKMAAACRSEWHRAAVLVLANTGLRVSAAMAMRWDWIDWRADAIHIPAHANKGGFAYTTYLNDTARDVLQHRLKVSISDWVFGPTKDPEEIKRPDRPPGYSAIKTAIERAIARAKLPEGTPHDLRHTFGRALHLAGAPQAVISALLGHASVATTEVYTRMGSKDALAFMRKLEFGPGPEPPA